MKWYDVSAYDKELKKMAKQGVPLKDLTLFLREKIPNAGEDVILNHVLKFSPIKKSKQDYIKLAQELGWLDEVKE